MPNLDQVDTLAKILWDYHHLNHSLKKADCIFVLGSRDIRVAEYSVELFKKGLAPYIVFSGGFGRITKNTFGKPEAETFADIARQKGIPESSILIENSSTNTGDNITFTKKLLAEKDLRFDSFIVVQKPYMERRTYATIMKQWPDKKILVTSPPILYEDYPDEATPKEQLINAMVGDLQRIKEYPKLGYQIPQDIPNSVLDAFGQLVALGFTSHLIKT